MKDLEFINGITCKFEWSKKGELKTYESCCYQVKENFFFIYKEDEKGMYILEVKVKQNQIGYLAFNDKSIADLVYDGKLIFIYTAKLGLLYYFYYQNKDIKDILEIRKSETLYFSDYIKVLRFTNLSILVTYEFESEHYVNLKEAKFLNEEINLLKIEN